MWIIGADTLTGLKLSAGGVAYRRLDDTEKRYVCRTHLGLPAGKPMVAVSESGFYKLVLRSDKPEAREFQEWVTREVLPAIRRTGGYRSLVWSLRRSRKASRLRCLTWAGSRPCDPA